MGLIHPVDLEAFQRDEARRQSFRRLRALRARLKPDPGPPGFWLSRTSEGPDVLLAFDSKTISCRAAVLSVLDHLDPRRVAILAPFPLDDATLALHASHRSVTQLGTIAELSAALPEVAAVVSAGGHGPAGAIGHDLAMQRHGASIVVQHGMLLPQVAPLPAGVTLAAWSRADADFWRSGRSDVETRVVGSELLHRATQAGVDPVPADATPVYCGALHGTELPRLEIERVARQFCSATGAHYRPHPSETDLQSRVTHLIWKRLGIVFAPSDRPLLQVGAPVVGMWSTGILEAAAAGLPAWVYHPDPPEWLREVWQRYGLSVWGSEPSPVSAIAAGEPAERLAELVEEAL